ncbi:Synaptic vesicle membrane protein VAT-1 [Chamberlinius hualienensis]
MAFVKNLISNALKTVALTSTDKGETAQDVPKMIQLSEFGAADKLQIVECHTTPEPTAGQLVVKIHYCGVNFSDYYAQLGLFRTRDSPILPLIMGREAAGEVIAVGPGETDFQINDKVACISSQLGLWSDTVVIDKSDAIKLPSQMSFREGAAFYVNYITANCVINGFGSLNKGQLVFVHSIGGGVGCAVLKLAKLIPGVIVMGTASAEKHEKLRQIGVDHLFTPNSYYVDQVLKLFPQGVDLIVDNKSGHEFHSARRMLAPLGKIIHIGANSVIRDNNWTWMSLIRTFWAIKSVALIDLIDNNHCVCGLNIDQLKLESPAKFFQIITELNDLYCQGKINQEIDSEWSFDEVRVAMNRFCSRKSIGKILLRPNNVQ